MKTILLFLVTLLVAQAAVPIKKYNLPPLQNIALDEADSTVKCLVDVGKSIKEHGLNELGPTYELAKDLYSTSRDLISHVIRCRRLWYENPTIWQEIAWQACRASLGAKVLFEGLRLKPIIETAIQEDFWVISVLQIRQCLKREVEEVKKMNYVEAFEKLDNEMFIN